MKPEDRLLREIFRGQDLDKHTYNVIIEKLREAGWDNVPESFGTEGNPVAWIQSELSHRVKGLYDE